MLRSIFSKRSRRSLRFDAMRAWTRLTTPREAKPTESRLHVGCGKKRIPSYVNIDVRGSDLDVDLAGGRLPFVDAHFEVVISQQVIEHLDIESELLPLLREIRRVMRPDGEFWVSAPDMERIARSYLADGGKALLDDRQRRWPEFSLNGMPTGQMMNVLFHQAGEHVNLFDEPLLTWVLHRAGFSRVERTDEATFEERFPEFPRRQDEPVSIYAIARP